MNDFYRTVGDWLLSPLERLTVKICGLEGVGDAQQPKFHSPHSGIMFFLTASILAFARDAGG